MFLFLLLALHLCTAYTVSNVRFHNAETLNAKCDALPFRSVFLDGRCYFAIGKEQSLEGAKDDCASILPGSKLIKPLKNVIQNFFLEISDFHRPTEAGDRKKQALCLYESIIECASGDQPQLPGGKCAIRSDKKMNYPDAVKFCNSKSAVLALIANSKEQQSIYNILRSDPAWVGVTVTKNGWSETHHYKSLTTCKAANLTAPNSLSSVCSPALALAAMPKGEGQTYSSLGDQKSLMDVICLRDASSAFWTVKKAKPVCKVAHKWCLEEHEYDPVTKQCKKTGKTVKSAPPTDDCTYPPGYCAHDHRVDPATGECEWTGPKDACARIINVENGSMFVMQQYPPKPGQVERSTTTVDFEHRQCFPHNNKYNAKIVKVVVRRRCMVALSAYGVSQVLTDRYYGEYEVRSFYAGTLSKPDDGATAVHCWCTPPLKNLEPVADTTPCTFAPKFCEEEHKYNPKTKDCEWTGPKEACMKLITHDNQSFYLSRTAGDTDYNNKMELYLDLGNGKHPDKVYKAVRTVIRRGCWGEGWSGKSKKILHNAHHGPKTFPNFYAGTAATIEDGLRDLKCGCNPPMGLLEPPATPVGCVEKKGPDFCAEDHRVDPTTGECEWTGPKGACAKLYHVDNRTMYAYIPEPSGSLDMITKHNDLMGTDFNAKVVKVVIRRRCTVAIKSSGAWQVMKDTTYGEYVVSSYYTRSLNKPEDGAAVVTCFCYPPLKNIEPQSVKN